jgi:hypothetical protein
MEALATAKASIVLTESCEIPHPYLGWGSSLTILNQVDMFITEFDTKSIALF